MANIVPIPKIAEILNTICAPSMKALAELPLESFDISLRSPTKPLAIIIEEIIAVDVAVANNIEVFLTRF